MQVLNKTAATRIHYVASIGAMCNLFFGITSIVLPFIALLVWGTDEFSRKHGRQAIKFQIFVLMYGLTVTVLFALNLMMLGLAPAIVAVSTVSPATHLAMYFLLLVTAFLLLMLGLALWLMAFFMPFRAAGKADQGLPYAYPFTFSKE